MNRAERSSISNVLLRPALMLVALLLIALTLAACGETATSSPATTTSAATTTTAAAMTSAAVATTANAANSGQTVTIRIGTGDSGDGLTPYNQTIELFKKANPGIEIKVEPVTDSDYYGSLLTQAAANKAPDLIFIGDDEVADFVKKGVYEDLTPYISGTNGGTKFDTSVFYPNVLQPGQQSGKQYLIPKDFSSICVYYNKALFKAAGVPEPTSDWTFEDMAATAQKLTVKDAGGKTTQYGIQLPAAWPRGFEALAFAEGGKLISPDGTKYAGFMDSDQAVKALQYYSDLYHKGVAAPPSDINKFLGGNDNFQQGTAAMQISGHWPQSSYLKNDKLKNNLGVVGLPKGTTKANAIAWGGFGIYSKSQHKTEAWKVLSFFVSPQGGGQFFKDWGLTPLQPIAATSTNPLDKVWLDQAQYFQPITANFTPYWNSAGSNELQEAMQKAITDPNPNIADILKQAAAKADKNLKDKLGS